MSYAWAITTLFGVYFAGFVVSYLTKGSIGTALFATFFMLFGFNLNLIPKDIIPASNLAGTYALLFLTILIHVGSSFDFKKLKNDWRLVVSVLCGIVGMAVTIIGIGGALFGRQLSIMSFPTLVGGAIATSLMTQAATEKGLAELAAIVVLVQSVQGWVGMPLITYGVKKEAKRLLASYRETDQALSANRLVTAVPTMEEVSGESPTIFDRILPKPCHNIYFYMFLSCFYGAVASVIAAYTGSLTGGIVGSALVGIVLGCALTQFGLLPKEPLVKAGLLDFFMFVLIITMCGNLANLSLSSLVSYLIPIAGLVALGAAGMLALVIPIGKKLGYATGMCFAFGMGCYCGYPGNYQIANEIINILAETKEENQYLRNEILTRVVEGSVVSVSITSVVLAGVFVSLI